MVHDYIYRTFFNDEIKEVRGISGCRDQGRDGAKENWI